MSRTARLWKGFGSVTLGGLMLSGVVARAEGPAPLSAQLSNLGRQAAAQGRTAEARTFFTQALRLDPADASARAGLDKLPKARLAAFQAPAAAPGDQPNTPPQATLERQRELENVRRQEFTTDVRQRLQRARDLTNGGRPEEALSALRVLLAAVQEADQVAEADKTRLANEVRVAILSTERTEERLNLERAEKYRIASAESARIDALDRLIRDQETTSTLMNEFDSLMLQGQYRILSNAGRGNINDILQPFVDARARAVAARAIDPLDLAPHAGITLAESIGFLSQSLAYEELKEYRFMFTLADVDRASVPFPDTNTIEYPLARDWQALSERRIKKYSNADYIFNRDERTQAILNKLEERVSMNFPNETPLEDVLKYIKSSTQDEAAGLPQGIPIYLDPVGLSEAEKTPTSTVTLDLEGVPLRVSLRLILKQLDLTYTVKDGHMQITYAKSEDQQLEIRVYQVADLAIIPLSLMGGGGGGMGGGMGGMGGGMGGMGGGMGGMGGGMGGGGMGGGMGGMGGMMSVAPQAPGAESSFQQKKSN